MTEVQKRLTGFQIYYRNPGHWDINTYRGREFRIRGGDTYNSNVVVFDERLESKKSNSREFKNVVTALCWCCDELRNEIETGYAGLPS
jgi:hypothetical protein